LARHHRSVSRGALWWRVRPPFSIEAARSAACRPPRPPRRQGNSPGARDAGRPVLRATKRLGLRPLEAPCDYARFTAALCWVDSCSPPLHFRDRFCGMPGAGQAVEHRSAGSRVNPRHSIGGGDRWRGALRIARVARNPVRKSDPSGRFVGAPDPPTPWTTTREATRNGPPAVFESVGRSRGQARHARGQRGLPHAQRLGARFEPTAVPKGAERLPVLVWIHGGGNTIGIRPPMTAEISLRRNTWSSWPSTTASGPSAGSDTVRCGPRRRTKPSTPAILQSSISSARPSGCAKTFRPSAAIRVTSPSSANPKRGLFQHAIVESGGFRILEASQAENYRPEWTAWDDSSADSPRYLVLTTAEHGGVRMATRAETRGRIFRMWTSIRVFRELVAFGSGFSEQQYPTAGARGCAEFPFDAYPWASAGSDAAPR